MKRFLVTTLCFLFSFSSLFGGYTARERLTDADDRKLYAAILSSLQKKEQTIENIPMEFDHAAAIYRAVLADHPELFYVRDPLKGNNTFTNNTFTSSNLQFTYMADTAKKEEQVESAAKPILKAIKGLSPSEQARYCYDHLIATSAYDIRFENDQSLYGVLCFHRGVCAGFARAYQYLMQEAGIECLYVTGTLRRTGEAHSWNIIKIGNDYYHVDVTSGLGGSANGTIDESFFCITTNQIKKTHRIDQGQALPSCTSATYSQSFLLESYDRKQVERIIFSHLDRPAFALEFSSRKAYQEAKQDLLDGNAYLDLWFLHGVDATKVSYQLSDERCLISLSAPSDGTVFTLVKCASLSEAKDAIRNAWKMGKSDITLSFPNDKEYRKAYKWLFTDEGLFDLLPDLSQFHYSERERIFCLTITFS